MGNKFRSCGLLALSLFIVRTCPAVFAEEGRTKLEYPDVDDSWVSLPDSPGVFPLAFSADGNLLVAAGKIYDLRTSQIYGDPAKYGPYLADASRVVLSPDNARMGVFTLADRKVFFKLVNIADGAVEVDEKIGKADNWKELMGEANNKLWNKALAKAPQIKDFSDNILAATPRADRDCRYSISSDRWGWTFTLDVKDATLPNYGAKDDRHFKVSSDCRYFARYYDNIFLNVLDTKKLFERLAPMKEANAAVQKNPGDAAVYFKRGYLFTQRVPAIDVQDMSGAQMVQAIKDYNKAAEDFSKTISLDPKHAQARLLRGLVQFRLFRLFEKVDWDSAIADLKEAARLGPKLDNSEVRSMIHLAGRIQATEKTIQVDNKNGPAYYERALIYLSLRMPFYAAMGFVDARANGLTLKPSEEQLVARCRDYHLAEAKHYMEVPCYACARDSYRGALNYDPDSSEIKSSMESADRMQTQRLADIERATDEKIKSYKPGGIFTQISFSGIATSILDGVNAGSSSGGGSSYSSGGSGGSGYSSGSGSSGGSGWNAQAAADKINREALQTVQKNVEQKLWNMNNPYK